MGTKRVGKRGGKTKRIRARTGNKGLDAGMALVQMGEKFHYSLSNLPLAEWHEGVTLCRRKGRLWRCAGSELITTDQLCKQCTKELQL